MDRIGGAFALLTFVHFAVDWIFQSHGEAMRKHNQWRVRARHCAIYTVPFAVILGVTTARGTTTPPVALAMCGLLFLSHFVEDTYLPVLLWAKYVRRPPSMQWRVRRHEDGLILEAPEVIANRLEDLPPDEDRMWRLEIVAQASAGRISLRQAVREIDRRGFIEFISDPLGKILMIAVDQIVHIAFLLPVAWAVA